MIIIIIIKNYTKQGQLDLLAHDIQTTFFSYNLTLVMKWKMIKTILDKDKIKI